MAETDYCDCGLPWLQDDGSCSRCDKKIDPTRLEVIKENPIYTEAGQDVGDPETYVYLYEVGFVSIENSKVKVSERLTDLTALRYVKELNGRQVEVSKKQLEYFKWHLENRFQRAINPLKQ